MWHPHDCKPAETVTVTGAAPAAAARGHRKRIHATNAERQRAYRRRKAMAR